MKNHSISKSLFRKASAAIPGGVNSPVRAFKAVGGNPLFIDRAKGSRIYDVDGNSYIDYVLSWGPMILGHAFPRVVNALKKAAEAWLPKSIVYRPKGLFSAPLRAWIRRDLVDMVEDLVAGGTLITSGLVAKQTVRPMIGDDRRGAADRSKEIWQLLTLEVWHRQQGSDP